MTARINVNKGSAYAHLIGKSFQVKAIHDNFRQTKLVTLLINSVETDFLLEEVILN